MHRSSKILEWFNDLSPSRIASVCSLNGGFRIGEQRSGEDTQLRPGKCDVVTGGDVIFFALHFSSPRQAGGLLPVDAGSFVSLCVCCEVRQFLRRRMP